MTTHILSICFSHSCPPSFCNHLFLTALPQLQHLKSDGKLSQYRFSSHLSWKRPVFLEGNQKTLPFVLVIITPGWQWLSFSDSLTDTLAFTLEWSSILFQHPLPKTPSHGIEEWWLLTCIGQTTTEQEKTCISIPQAVFSFRTHTYSIWALVYNCTFRQLLSKTNSVAHSLHNHHYVQL